MKTLGNEIKNKLNRALAKNCRGTQKLSWNPKKLVAMTFTLILILPSLAFFNLTPTATAVTSNDLLKYEWPMMGADPQNSYYNPGPAPNTPNILWKRTITGIGSDIVAFNGMVFVRDNRGMLYALDGFTGDTVWKIALPGSVIKIDETYMMVGTACVKIADGTLVWTAPPGFGFGAFFSGTTYVPELKLFVANGFRGGPISVWSLPDSSKVPFKIWESSYYYGLPSITVYGEGRLFVGTLDNFIVAHDIKTGEILWTQQATVMSHYGMSYIDGKVVFGGLDNKMHAWDAKTGELLWTYDPGTWYGQWAVATGAAYGMVFEHNQDTYVYAVNASNGQLVWRAKGPGIGYSNKLSIADGKVYVQMGENQYRDFDRGEFGYSEFNCYDAFTGDLLWSIPIENNAPSNWQAIAYGNLYIIPTRTQGIEGVWGGRTTLNEIWCISDKGADYSMFLGNPEHTAFGYGPTNLELKWAFRANASLVSSPTLVDGVVYFGSMDGYIFAVDAISGDKLWSFKTDYMVKSSVAVVAGKVYTGSDDGKIYCLDAKTGTKVWEVNAGGIKYNDFSISITSATFGATIEPRSSPVVFKNRVYVGSLDGNLYCINADTGTVIWKVQTGGSIHATPTIFENAIYIPSCTPSPNGHFYKLDLNGNIVWNLTIPYVLNRTLGAGFYLLATPTVAPDLGLVFLRNGLYLNYAINASSGEIVWTYRGRYNPGTPAQSGGVTQKVAMLYTNGLVIFNDFYGIVALNAKTGQEVWYTWLSRENLGGGLSQSYGRVYTTTVIGTIYVLDMFTGKKLFSYDLGNSDIKSVPTPYNGYLFVTASDWNLYCFTEAPKAAPPTPEPIPEPLTADAIAQKVIDKLPAYPNCPSADEITQKLLSSLPSYPTGASAEEVAQRVLANLPSHPTAEQIAHEIRNQLKLEQQVEFSNPMIVIIVAVAVAIIIGIANLNMVRKRK